MATAQPHDQSSDTGRSSLLDDWQAEVGEEEIARIAREVRRDADAGLIPSFTDRDSLLAHWRELADGA